MDVRFKNLSFPVTFWQDRDDSPRSLLPLRQIGFLPRKTGWVRGRFATTNFSLILNGGGEFHRHGRCWKIKAPCVITQWNGDYLEYGPAGRHDYWTELYFVYGCELMPVLAHCGFVDESRPVWPVAHPEALRPLLGELARCLANGEKSARLDRLAERIILETVLPPNIPASPAVARALEAMQENWPSPPGLEAVARRCNLSVSTFQRRWRETMGITPARYALGLRLQEACRLLLETGGSIAEVARACGFEDEFYFSRCFRRQFGVPPRSYRQEHRIRRGQPRAG